MAVGGARRAAYRWEVEYLDVELAASAGAQGSGQTGQTMGRLSGPFHARQGPLGGSCQGQGCLEGFGRGFRKRGLESWAAAVQGRVIIYIIATGWLFFPVLYSFSFLIFEC